jgi:two-component system cell cycle response regulator
MSDTPEIQQNGSNAEARIAELEADRKRLVRIGLALKAQNDSLQRTLSTLEERMIRCPLTGLYNENFFLEYMKGAVDISMDIRADGILLFISIDSLRELNIRYGTDGADETLKKFAAFLPNLVPEEAVLFRLSGALFASYIAGTERENGASLAERVRAGMEAADIFVEKITVSIGVVAMSEFMEDSGDNRTILVDRILDLAKRRIGLAHRMGSNAVCATSDLDLETEGRLDVLLADSDAFRRNLVSSMLKSRGFAVHETSTGAAALELATRLPPALVISDLALPGFDAISLRVRMRETTELSRVPFILVTDRKSADIAARAYAAGVSVILQRPILIDEILGLVMNLTGGSTTRGR